MATAAMSKILAPVDLSSCSRAAFEYACKLALAFAAPVEVLLVRSSAEGPEPSAGELAAARAELHRFVASFPATAAARITERVETGDARERIVGIAEGEGFDVIVLGTHGRTGRPRSLAGSVAESVVRTSSCPVITVREPR
ncbi:MAG TPA: universal stress protein [Polyangiaceae bacterium]|nr:universal stress protein [Polyangiaceae bacterium]